MPCRKCLICQKCGQIGIPEPQWQGNQFRSWWLIEPNFKLSSWYPACWYGICRKPLPKVGSKWVMLYSLWNHVSLLIMCVRGFSRPSVGRWRKVEPLVMGGYPRWVKHLNYAATILLVQVLCKIFNNTYGRNWSIKTDTDPVRIDISHKELVIVLK